MGRPGGHGAATRRDGRYGGEQGEIARQFGKPVAEPIDGLSKLDKIEFQSHQEAQAENFRKMLMAMARDLRVVLIACRSPVQPADDVPCARQNAAASLPKPLKSVPDRESARPEQPLPRAADLSFQLIYPLARQRHCPRPRAARGNRRELLSHPSTTSTARCMEAGIAAMVFGREKPLFDLSQRWPRSARRFRRSPISTGFASSRDIP